MDEILRAWREGGYRPSPDLLDTMASFEAGPLGYWIEIGLGRYRMSTCGPRAAVESSRPPGWSLTGWSVMLGAAMVCEPSRTAGRPDTDRVRRVVARFLDSMSNRHESEGTTAPPASAAPVPPSNPRGRGGRVKPVVPPPPEEPDDPADDALARPGYRH